MSPPRVNKYEKHYPMIDVSIETLIFTEVLDREEDELIPGYILQGQVDP